MGHMKAARQGTWSTTKKKEVKEEEEPPLEPPRPHLERDKNHQVIYAIIPANELKGLVCTNLPGKFPIESELKNNYIFIMYDFDSNNILGKSIKTRDKSELVQGFEMCYKELQEANIIPILHWLDNEVSDNLIEAIKKKEYENQIVMAYDHWQNLAEWAIQTNKSYLISNLHGTDREFPAKLWCRLLEQMKL